MKKGMRRPRGPGLWLISDGGSGRDGFLSMEHGGGRSLVVFGFAEEAELFLWFAGLGDGWRAVGKEGGEVLSLLGGPGSDVDGVVLDPLPNGLFGEMDGFARLGRERFEEWLARRDGFGSGAP